MIVTAKQTLKHYLEQLFKLPVFIDTPDPSWLQAPAMPYAEIRFGSFSGKSVIEDGVPDSTEELNDYQLLEKNVIVDADITFAVHLFGKSDKQLDQFCDALNLDLFSGQADLGDNLTFTGEIEIRDEQPEETAQRIFERIISIPVNCQITKDDIVDRLTPEFELDVSAEAQIS